MAQFARKPPSLSLEKPFSRDEVSAAELNWATIVNLLLAGAGAGAGAGDGDDDVEPGSDFSGIKK